MTAPPVPTLPWPDVVAGIAEQVEEQPAWKPLLEFVLFLSRSRYARSLFPRLAGTTLAIGRSAGFEPGRDALRIEFDPASATFRFTWQRTPDEAEPWSRECAAANGRTEFERLLHKKLQWFHEG